MENAADALKMVLGIFMFVLGLSLFFFMINQVKATSDVVLFMSDKTNFYDMDKLQSDSATGDRKVGLETVIPNIYRYFTENTGITIIDKNSEDFKFIRYSTSDDARCGVDLSHTDDEYKTFDEYIDNYIMGKLKIEMSKGDIEDFYKKKFGDGSNYRPAIWNGDQKPRVQRVYADVTGVTETINGNNYNGINLLEKYKDKKFTESFIETVISETKTGTIDTKKKQSIIEIIYTVE